MPPPAPLHNKTIERGSSGEVPASRLDSGYNMTMRSVLAATIGTLLLVLPFAARAQLMLPGIENSVIMTMTPEYPAPGDAVHISLQSPILDLASSTIVWKQDGVIDNTSINSLTFDTIAGAAGSQSTITADVTTSAGDTAESSITIAPTELDLFYDSDSYVPPFYRGRALPAAGTTLRIQAIARFKQASGFVPDSQIIYTWKENGAPIKTASGRGKSSITIATSPLSSAENISVRADSVDGAFTNETTENIPLQKPLLLLYEDNPLFGILFNQALAPQTSFTASDITIAAIPYFVPAQQANDPALSYEWMVNNTPVTSTSSVTNEIELGASNPGSVAYVRLDVSSIDNPFIILSNSWNVTLSASDAQQRQATQSPADNRFMKTD